MLGKILIQIETQTFRRQKKKEKKLNKNGKISKNAGRSFSCMTMTFRKSRRNGENAFII